MEELNSAVAAGRKREEHTTSLVSEMQHSLDTTRHALAEVRAPPPTSGRVLVARTQQESARKAREG